MYEKYLKRKKYLFSYFSLILTFFSLSSLNCKLKNKVSSEIIIWAWERPEHLLFIEEKNTQVAFFAGVITFNDSETHFRPRFQPIFVNPETKMMAVFRIENRKNNSPPDNQQIIKAANYISETVKTKGISSCQIDYDVKSSEINSFKSLINNIRKRLPESTFLSVTALASWCHTGSWIEKLNIDEIVPMFFRLGYDEHIIRNDLAGKTFMKSAIYQKAIGISTDEPLPLPKYLRNRKIYIFNPKPWNPDKFYDIVKQINNKLKNGS